MPVYFTADTHFGDPRVLRIDRRPFASVAAHDAALIGYWNEAVGPDDEVWHLGDFARGSAERIGEILAALNGVKHLVTGNNDGRATLEQPAWASVEAYAELDVEGTKLVLCHYAFRTWKNMGKGWLDLHGHSHGRLKTMPRQYDVGVDARGYRPVTLQTLLATKRRGGLPPPTASGGRGEGRLGRRPSGVGGE